MFNVWSCLHLVYVGLMKKESKQLQNAIVQREVEELNKLAANFGKKVDLLLQSRRKDFGKRKNY